jgi:hypothetical protein
MKVSAATSTCNKSAARQMVVKRLRTRAGRSLQPCSWTSPPVFAPNAHLDRQQNSRSKEEALDDHVLNKNGTSISFEITINFKVCI